MKRKIIRLSYATNIAILSKEKTIQTKEDKVGENFNNDDSVSYKYDDMRNSVLSEKMLELHLANSHSSTAMHADNNCLHGLN